MIPIKHTLLSVGISPDYEGFYFLTQLIKRRLDWLASATKPKYLITEEYAAVSNETYGPAAVKRAARYAIECAYDKISTTKITGNNLLTMLNNIISPDSGKPTIKEFVCTTAEYLHEAELYDAFIATLKEL